MNLRLHARLAFHESSAGKAASALNGKRVWSTPSSRLSDLQLF